MCKKLADMSRRGILELKFKRQFADISFRCILRKLKVKRLKSLKVKKIKSE